ncbi:MAG: EamA/RhaT family transporter, partial [Desulfobacteraceae bacterium]|nr:EamA/RhaT family transporter [Desulfobacteraceae bacterium]
QYLLTIGFKYVTAIEGGIISSTRILLAAMLGPFIAMDSSLSLSGWIGAFLIFAANVYLATRKAKG